MIFIIVFLFIGIAQNGHAGAWTRPAGTSQFSPSISFYSTQRQFATSGELTHLYFDGTFYMTVLSMYGEWGIMDDLTVIGDLPLVHVIFEARDSTHSYSRTLTSPAYVGGGIRYALWRPGSSVLSVSAVLHVPPGFHNGLYNDPTHPFLSDGFFEEIVGLEYGMGLRWGWVEAVAAYHARAEEAANQLEMRGVVGFSSQRLVQMKLTLAAVKSLAHLPDTPVNAERTVAVEDYLWLDGQVIFWVGEKIAIAASLGARILGAHTLALNGGGISVVF